MRILIITSYNKGKVLPFVEEQVEALNRNFGIEFEYFLIKKKGAKGYLAEIFRYRKFLRDNSNRFDLVHAHYGLSGLLAVCQRYLKTVITFHGSDINYLLHRGFSQIAILLSTRSIFVTNDLGKKVITKRSDVVPCGLYLGYEVVEKEEARSKLGWNNKDIIILFSSSFKREEKNAKLAFETLEELKKTTKNVQLLELDGYSREEINLLMCGADLMLLTSKREGSPQVIKESVFFRLPIVSTDVGNIKEILLGVDSTHVVEADSKVLALHVAKVLESGNRIKNNESIITIYDNDLIATKIYSIYKEVLS